MKKKFLRSASLILFFGLMFSAVQPELLLAQGDDGNISRKIVVFQTGLNEAAKDKIIAHVGGVKVKNLDLIGARVVLIPSQAAAAKLAINPLVVRIDDDVTVEALGKPAPAPQPIQQLPWGVDKIDAELVWPSSNSANPIKVGIIDTGISKDHPDLKANVQGGINTINPRKSWTDDNGHGSHVAGIIAALDNSIGAIGVAHTANLYAIKALNQNGSGYLSDVIEGIEWSVNSGMEVINMSLGTETDIQSFHDAVTAAKNTGVVIVAAAGNSGGSVSYPAAYPETIAISATDSTDNLANFSSRGSEVDLAAPGVSIYSTYKGTGYATLSGTSMAAPHVVGIVALVLNTPVGSADTNTNGRWDPDEIQNRLESTASDLGNSGFDNLYGWGLANALKAVQP